MEMRPMTTADPKMAGRGEIHMCSAGIPGARLRRNGYRYKIRL